MTLTVAILFAIVQGLTEFLPISSSGHLVLLRSFFDLEYGMDIEVWFHFGTLLSLLAFFHKDIRTLYRNPDLVLMILLSTGITVLIALILKSRIVNAFMQPESALVCFGITGVVLLATRWTKSHKKAITWQDAAVFGLVQSAALMPGISRSGITIACLLMLGHSFQNAFRYSFLAVIPVIIGAFCLQWAQGTMSSLIDEVMNAALFVTFIVGLGSLWFLRRVLVQHKFHYFAYYCFAVAILGFLNAWSILNPN